MKKYFQRRIGLVLLLLCPIAAPAQYYFVEKYRGHTQVGNKLYPAPNQMFSASYNTGGLPPEVTNAFFVLPNGGTNQLTTDWGVPAYRWSSPEPYPSGAYEVVFETAEARYTASLNLPDVPAPPAPKIANWAELQFADNTKPITVRLSRPTGGSTNYQVRLVVTRGGLPDIYSTKTPLDPGFSGVPPVDHVTIPADALMANRTYLVNVSYVTRTDFDTNSVPGLTGYAAESKVTSFRIQTFSPTNNSAFEFTAPSFSRSEGFLGPVMIRRSNSYGPGFVTLTAGAGTATLGRDFLPFESLIVFDPGTDTMMVPIHFIDDQLLESTETIPLTLSSPLGGATIGAMNQARLNIIDDETDSVGVIQFRDARTVVSETSALARVHLTRNGGTNEAVLARVHSMNGKAIEEQDFSPVATVPVEFGPGETHKTISVPIVNDTIAEGNEGFGLVLSSATDGAAFGPQNTTLVTIVDDDRAGVVNFSAPALKFNEGRANAAVVIVRSGGEASDVSVAYQVRPGSATAADVALSQGRLTFGAGEMSKTLLIPIARDTLPESSETFFVQLSAPQGGLSLGPTREVSVTIVDND